MRTAFPAFRFSLLSLLAAALLLAGCQHLPQTNTHFTQASQIHRWDMTGKLGYRTVNDGGSANFTWHQTPQHGAIHFSGPLGFGSAELTWDSHLAVLKTKDGTYRAGSPAELARQLTGFRLPVAALEYWSRGLAWPRAPARSHRDANDNLVRLQQLGWTLQFDRYRKVGDVPLPHRIKASKNDNRFTLLVREWRPLPTLTDNPDD